jgi:hypothetical protein
MSVSHGGVGVGVLVRRGVAEPLLRVYLGRAVLRSPRAGLVRRCSEHGGTFCCAGGGAHVASLCGARCAYTCMACLAGRRVGVCIHRHSSMGGALGIPCVNGIRMAYIHVLHRQVWCPWCCVFACVTVPRCSASRSSWRAAWGWLAGGWVGRLRDMYTYRETPSLLGLSRA